MADTDALNSATFGSLAADLHATRWAAAKFVGMTCEGRTSADNATVRNVFVIGPDRLIKLIIAYPMRTGRDFDEVVRVIDSVQLTAKHKVATPVNWKQGQDVIIVPALSDDEAKTKSWRLGRP
jgi:alkyl hydroperoxide reductase subunit AhpC